MNPIFEREVKALIKTTFDEVIEDLENVPDKDGVSKRFNAIQRLISKYREKYIWNH